MVLKNDGHTDDFCQDIDAKEGSCSNVLASDWRDHKDLGQGNDSCSLNQRTNNEKEVLDSGTLKDDGSGSCKAGLASSLGQGVETVDLRSNTGSPQLGYDMEDRRLEVRKGSELSEASIQRSSESPKDKSHCHSEKAMQSNEVMESDEKCESSLQTSLGEEVDESDVEEEDVKVCDICGDAGREDLLAVCSRCSDGAEHTYCMREMLDKVPESDWFCEECKLSEELEAQKQEHQKLLGCSEKSKSFGRMGSVNLDLPHKLDSKDSFCERSKMKNVSLSKQLSSKRSGDSIEAGPIAKKQVIESSTGSPTTSSPSRVPVLSKDYSIKNLDKTKGKQTSQFSTGTESAGDSSENTRSPPKHIPHNQKGDFVKSNSFGSANSKANVKVLDEVVQKQKQGLDAKDGSGKFIGKSTSFKGLGRSSVSEPKVKMLSPKCAPVQELKGHKQVRDRSSFERKNSIKLDHTTSVQTSANPSKRLSRADSISTPASNNRDYKIAHSDGKVTNLPKQALANKAPEAMTSLGEAKRLSSTNIRGSGTSNSTEAKPNHINRKDGSTSNPPRAADGFLVGANGGKAEVHDNQIEKSLENTFGRSRQGVNGALVSGNHRSFSTDSSVLRAKEGMREENRLKAAIEAAMQKKQHIFKKNKLPENLNDLSASNTHVDVSNQMTDSTPEEVVHARDAGLSNNNLNTCKDTFISSAKQLKVYPADYVISTEEDAVTSVSAVPEPEAVWQGGFEIHRNGKLPDVCGGFQAHLSSFASGKVLEVVRKLPSKIVLNEVVRSCAWPFQFKDLSAREDNIALYFFAKDLDSYLRSYKILLEYMMKHDLALRGDINGVELLVFPSNLLAHKSQRWNNLFFMWGVFRGRRVRCQDDTYTALERPEISVSMSNIVPRIKDVSIITEDVSVSGCDTIISRHETPVLDASSLQKHVSLSNGDSYDKDCNKNRSCLTSPTSKGKLENSPKNSSPVLCAEAFSESGTTGLVDQILLDPKINDQHQLKQEVGSGNNIHDSKESLSDPILEKHNIVSHSSTVVKQEDCHAFPSEQQVLCTAKSDVGGKFENDLKKEDQGLGKIEESGGQVKLENKVNLENKVEQDEENKDSMWNNDLVQLKRGGSLKREGFVDINVSAEGSMDDLHSLQCSPMRHSEEDLNKPVGEAAPVIPCQKRSWVDKKDTSEDSPQAYIGKKTKESDVFGCDLRRSPSSFGDRIAARIQDVSTSSRIEDASNEVINDKLTSVSAGSAERCFFLVDPQAAESVLSDDHTSPWKVSLLGNDNRLPDGSPNLELALGVEKKQSRKGSFPFFAGIVDRKGPDRPPDITTAKEGDEDASASLSLSLAFPFSDKESPASSERPLTDMEQTLPARREANTSLLLFRGASGK